MRLLEIVTKLNDKFADGRQKMISLAAGMVSQLRND